ncbi:uncharacterized protein LOC123556852 [Mercenaria mercenaria]|uniref:uncharacterized protein LOC123556852 n=1 Tax=Mercenaria mercenaria TaxID=6596 RepID=UPI00234FAA1D|nr:uncharacterized protein LOC123556852 [Mercenaria mercenaria]XP_053399080.1 uncharacterized protein LOC123556852 [Mercenaria mercenaria]XP_053399081.1 uncharacterized protein LOC123556852 [Mercenaria mercenaria]
METDTEFKLDEWDDRSEISTLHLSFIIQTLLPIRWIGWKNGPAYKSYQKFLSENQSSEEDSVMYIPTGSQAEGIGIPEAIRKGSIPPTPEIFSDTDVLCIIKGMRFSTNRIDEPSGEFHGYLDYEHSPPGYVRLCLLTLPKNPSMVIHDQDTGKHYLSSSNVSNYMFSNLTFTDADEEKVKYQQGPAMTITDRGKLMLNKKVKVQPFNEIPTDIVPAFICSPWPEKAKCWESRGRESGWLNPRLVTSVIADGCHVVGVPSKTSLKPDIEWRLSFSASEGRLAREAVTDHQRQCYIYLKILRYQIMQKEVTALSSYVFKSVFLHCCEKLPVSLWKDYPGNCVLYMLDVLLQCLHRKHVPTYFLSETNLVSHLNESDFQTAIKVIEKLRSDPITPVLEFMDHRCLLMQPLLGTFRMMMTPVLEDMKQFKQHRNKLLSIKCGISQSIFLICSLYLREHADGSDNLTLRKHQEAVKCLATAFSQWLHKVHPNDTLVTVINAYGLSLQALEYSVRFFKAAVSLSDEYPELGQCRGNLACMLHACAYAKESQINTDYLNQAGELFEQDYTESKAGTVDYVTFLLKQNEYEKAKEILEHFLGHCSHLFDMLYSYSTKELNTVDEPLRCHIEANGNVTGDAFSFACYYLVKCLCALTLKGRSLEIKNVLHDLQQHRKDKKSECSFDFYEQAKTVSLQNNK